MLSPLRSNTARKAVTELLSMAPPVGGMNARDPLANMKPTDAITLENVFPGINTCSVRKGYAQAFAGGSVTPVQTLMTYFGSNGTDQMFAAKSGKFYKALTSTLNSVYSTLITVNKWQYTNFSNTAGQWLLTVNGTDYQRRYNGTNWSVNGIAGSIPSSGKTCINIFQFKERIFLVEKNTLNLWYLATQAINGTAAKLPLGGVFNKGGQIVAGGTLSYTAGSTIDDYLVAVTDNGEAAIYTGITPGSDFALRGVFEVGQPIGNRCLTNVGGDLIITTTKGALPLSKIINNDLSKADDYALTAKIAPKFNSDTQAYGANFGWQPQLYPKGGYILFNVPVAEQSSQYQWVQNVLTGAWCKFTGWNANCWTIYNDEPYFGGNDGKVYRANYTMQDNAGQINFELKTAFNYCGSSARNKFFTAFRSNLLTSGAINVLAGLDVDFSNNPPTGTPVAAIGNAALWGSGLWGTSQWGGSGFIIKSWLGSGKIGACVSFHLKGASNGRSVDINSFDALYEKAAGQIY